MGKYTMWIVLAALILVVIGFLVFSSIWDRKKQKKIKIHQAKIKKDAHLNISRVAIWITAVVQEVQTQLKLFVPSIGKHKMSDINNIAKKELIKIKESREFKTIIVDKELYKTFVENIDILIKNKANLWQKKQMKVINFWKNQIGTSLTTDALKKVHDKFEKDTKKKVAKLYE